MAEHKLKRLQFESDAWKRLLCFMMDENVFLKNMLSEILKDEFDKKQLGQIEDFQNRFIKEDEVISLLRNDVAELDKLFKREVFEGGRIIKQVETKLEKMRNNIRIAEKRFSMLKSDFNSYMAENM
jgi:hypothetical protein